MKTTTTKCLRSKEIIVLSVIILSSFLLWDTIILYPIKLLTVFLHETGHSIAGLLSGARITNLNIDPNLGGSTEMIGGNSFFIISSGYLGSFILGGLFFFAGYSKEYSNWIIYLISSIIILVSANLIDNFVMQLSFVAFSVILILLVKFVPRQINKYIFMPIGIISCLYTIYDIREDIFLNNFYKSDAVLLAEITGVPDFIWAFIWISLSVAGLFILFQIACNRK